jgi:hypothetical protein
VFTLSEKASQEGASKTDGENAPGMEGANAGGDEYGNGDLSAGGNEGGEGTAGGAGSKAAWSLMDMPKFAGKSSVSPQASQQGASDMDGDEDLCIDGGSAGGSEGG